MERAFELTAAFALQPAATLALAVLALVVATVVVLRLRSVRSGFGELAKAARLLAKELHGHVERDGDDLRVTGASQGRRVFVWLSNSEEKPDLRIKIPVASAAVLLSTPKNYTRIKELGLNVRPVPPSQATFQLWSSTPREVELVLSPSVLHEFQKLATSPSFVSLVGHNCDFSQETVREGDVGRTGLSRVASLVAIAKAVDKMPGVDALPAESSSSIRWARVAEAITVTTVAALVLAFGRIAEPHPPATTTVSAISSGIPVQLPGLEDWRLMKAADFDADATAWLRQQEQAPAGEITDNLGPEGSNAHAYALLAVSGSGAARVVLLRDQQVVFDAELPKLQLMARIPAREFAQAEWRGGAPVVTPEGNGILLVKDYRDPGSGMVLYLSGMRVISLVPVDFKTLNLQ